MALCAASSVSAFDTKFSGALSTDVTTPLPYAKLNGEALQAEARANGELSLYITDKLTIFAEGLAIFDLLGYQGNSYDAGTDDHHCGVILKEAWIDYTSDYFAIRLGRQIEAWGKSDLFPVTNILCPKNYASFNFFELTDSYVGIDAARFSLKYDAYSLDFYWIPFVRTSVIPNTENHPIQNVVYNSSKILKLRVGPMESPSISPKNFEYAVKASGYFKYADVSLYGFYGWNREPTDFNIINKYICGSYTRMLMFGADASIPVGDCIVRLESAFYPQHAVVPISMYLLFADTTYTRRQKLKMLAGVDWMPGGWILTAQYYGDLTFGSASELTPKEYMHFVSFAASHNFFRDSLALSIAGLVQLQEWNNMFVLSAIYSASDNVTLSASAFFLNIISETDIDELDEFRFWGGVTIGAKYSF